MQPVSVVSVRQLKKISAGQTPSLATQTGQGLTFAKSSNVTTYNYGDAARLFEVGFDALQADPTLMAYYKTVLDAHQMVEGDHPELKRDQLALALAAQAYVMSYCYQLVDGTGVTFNLPVPKDKADKDGAWQELKQNHPTQLYILNNRQMLHANFIENSDQARYFAEVAEHFTNASLITEDSKPSRVRVNEPSLKTTFKRSVPDILDVLGAQTRTNKHLKMLFA